MEITSLHINYLLAIHSIEHLNRFKKKQAKIATSGKQKVNDKFNTVKSTFSRSSQSSESRIWKREVLEGRRRKLEEMEDMIPGRQKPPAVNERRAEELREQ